MGVAFLRPVDRWDLCIPVFPHSANYNVRIRARLRPCFPDSHGVVLDYRRRLCIPAAVRCGNETRCNTY
jgi:hypothetical protein